MKKQLIPGFVLIVMAMCIFAFIAGTHTKSTIYYHYGYSDAIDTVKAMLDRQPLLKSCDRDTCTEITIHDTLKYNLSARWFSKD